MKTTESTPPTRWSFFHRDKYLPEGMSPREDGEWVKWAEVLAWMRGGAAQTPGETCPTCEPLREFKKSVDNAVTVAFLSMTDDLGATDPREAIEHIRREFRDAEMKFQHKMHRCPTCRSTNRNVRLRYEGGYPQYPYHDCTDPWHSPAPAPQPKEISVMPDGSPCFQYPTGTVLKVSVEPAPQTKKESK